MLLFGQQDTVVLKDIIVTDIRLRQNKTQYIQNLNDSVIAKNAPLLTEFLNYKTPIYFREQGYGMTSSPSFRGTTASQTAVLWNGIEINSGFLGQVDFNTISSLNYDQISVKTGGGSVAYGSGAIGGSVHLNQNLRFNQGLKTHIITGYGSFNTLKLGGNLKYSNDKFAYNLRYSRNSSDNDYEVDELDYKNYNGNYWNNTLNANFAVKFNNNNKLSLFTEGYNDERHFSLIEENATKTKYRNQNFRSLLQYDNHFGALKSSLRVAFLNEKWKYYTNINNDEPYSQGDLLSFIGKYNGDYALNSAMNLFLSGEFKYQKAIGKGSGIGVNFQNSGNLGLTFSHQVFNKWYYELGVKNEFSSDYDSPFLFSFGTNYQPAQWYGLKLNISKNYRTPTFNDLYWQPGGNLNLKAESSMQYEVSHNFKFKQYSIGFNLYLNNIDDMIRWVPTDAGYWSPENVDEVRTQGIEVFAELKENWGEHRFQFNTTYAYTSSENRATGKQLTYVPYHKWNGVLTYGVKQYYATVEGLFVGKVYTSNDNANDLEAYGLMNLGVGFQQKKWNLQLKCNNILNKAYEAYINRVMPGRNYNITFNLKL